MTQEDKQILIAAIQRYIKGEHPHSQYQYYKNYGENYRDENTLHF